jgi:N6-adenosine-specific RNA methylase IME4
MAQAGQRFAVIYADPPWDFKIYSPKGKQRSAERYYDTSSLEAIKGLPIAPLATNDCALFLWGVWPELPSALEVIKAWSFEYKTAAFVWVKQNRDGDGLFTGMGYWTRTNSEFCLLATKGSPPRVVQDVPQIILAPVGEHSEKPETARTRIKRLLVGPYLELFARRTVPAWTVWGNEIASPRKAPQAPASTGVADSINATTTSSVADNVVLPPIPVPPTRPADGINTTTSSATDDDGLSIPLFLRRAP